LEAGTAYTRGKQKYYFCVQGQSCKSQCSDGAETSEGYAGMKRRASILARRKPNQPATEVF